MEESFASEHKQPPLTRWELQTQALVANTHARGVLYMHLPAACMFRSWTGHDPVAGCSLAGGDPCPKANTPFLLSLEDQGICIFIPFNTLMEITISLCLLSFYLTRTITISFYLTRTLTYLSRLCNFVLPFADQFYLLLNLNTDFGDCHCYLCYS